MKIPISSLPGFPVIFELLPEEIKTLRSVFVTECLKYEGSEIKNNSMVMVPNENGPQFYKIKSLMTGDNNRFSLIAQLYTDVALDEHFDLYEIESFKSKWFLLSDEEISGYTLTHYVKISDNRMFIVRNWL